MYHNEMEKIIEKVVKGDIDKNVLMEYLIDDFDCEKIYDSDEELITDAFFTFENNEWVLNQWFADDYVSEVQKCMVIRIYPHVKM